MDPFDQHRVLSDVETSGLEPIVVQTRGITRGRPRERTTLRESEDDLDRVAEERLYPVADPLTDRHFRALGTTKCRPPEVSQFDALIFMWGMTPTCD